MADPKAPTTAEVREMVRAAWADAQSDGPYRDNVYAQGSYGGRADALETVAVPIAEERDALAAEAAWLRADIELFQEMRAALVALGSRGQRGTTDELAAWTLARRLASEAVRGIITREYTVWCGRCSRWEQTGQASTSADAARLFRKGGWSKTEARGWLCSWCKGKGKEAGR